MNLQASQQIAAAMVRVTDPDKGSSPYFASLLYLLVRREVPGLQAKAGGPLAVTARGVLLYDPDAVVAMSPSDLAFGIEHEAMHLLLDHAARAKAIAVTDPDLWNLAADSVINDQLRTGGRVTQLPIVYPETLRQAQGLSAEQSYRLLQQQKQAGGGGGNGTQQLHKCGGCAGNPTGVDGDTPGEASDAEGRSPVEIETARAQVADAVADAAQSVKFRGKVPGGLVRWADAMRRPPKVPWQTLLRRSIRGAVSTVAGYVDLSWRGISRRQAGLGYGVGRPTLPTFRAPVPRIAVVLDTSGSMSRDNLTTACNEIAAILQTAGGDVTFIACDAKVHALQEVRSMRDVLPLLKGGGGTAMESAFTALGARAKRPNIVIVLTDGVIDTFAEPDWRPQTIWAVIDGQTQPNAWGKSVVVE